MAQEQDRVDQIRTVRERRRGRDVGPSQERNQSPGVRQRPRRTQEVTPVGGTGTADAVAATGTPQSPWLQDRVTLSLEAQIAMIEMRATYRLSLADMGYSNRLKLIGIRPGIFLKVEPTGCYKKVYHNRM